MTTELGRDPQPYAGQEPLDPALLQAIRPTATRMAAAEDAFIQLLSEDIATLVRHLPDRGWQLCERIARTVLWLALTDQPADTAVQSLHWLGAANQADGFPASDYVTVGHALVRIAREMSGIKWTTTTGSAWIRFFMWLQPHLQAGAKQAAHPEAAYPEPAAQQAAPQQQVPQQAAHPDTAYQQALRQQALHQEAARRQAAADHEAAQRQAFEQEAARQQAAADHEAAQRHAFDQGVHDTADDVDVSALADLLKGETEPAPAPVRDQTMPLTALDPDE